MNILAIDPGTKCGYAATLDGICTSGVWDLSVHRYEGDGMRYVRLRRYLQEIGKVDLIVFEEVRRHAGVLAAHIYGGIISHIMEFAERNKIDYVACPVGTLKKFATGKGNANKEAMIEACRLKLGINPEDSNQADALWLHAWAVAEYDSKTENVSGGNHRAGRNGNRALPVSS
nr:hypothetical protein 10 [bacterium]